MEGASDGEESFASLSSLVDILKYRLLEKKMRL